LFAPPLRLDEGVSRFKVATSANSYELLFLNQSNFCE
jgi:hypothetical protein